MEKFVYLQQLEGCSLLGVARPYGSLETEPLCSLFGGRLERRCSALSPDSQNSGQEEKLSVFLHFFKTPTANQRDKHTSFYPHVYLK